MPNLGDKVRHTIDKSWAIAERFIQENFSGLVAESPRPAGKAGRA